MKKKIIALVLALALIGVSAVSGTLAYLTDTDQGVNVFTVGNIDIELTEDVDVLDAAGNSIPDRVVKFGDSSAVFTNIMPTNYIKNEVTVTNVGKNDAYVRVAVILNNHLALRAAVNKYYEALGKTPAEIEAVYDYIFDGWGVQYIDDGDGAVQGGNANVVNNMSASITEWDATKFIAVDSYRTTAETGNGAEIDGYELLYYDGNTFGDKRVYSGSSKADSYGAIMNGYETMYVFFMHLEGGEGQTLFKGLNVPEYFDNDQIKYFENLKIEVYADAIQAEGFADAETAFKTLAAEHPLGSIERLNGDDMIKDLENFEKDGYAFIKTAEDFTAALDAVATGEVAKIVLADDIDLDAAVGADGKAASLLTVPTGKKATIDLNGNTITYDAAPTANGNYKVFTVNGDLTIVGGGTVEVNHTGVNMGWGALSAAISIEGGTLTLGEGVSVIHNGGTDMAYAVDVNSTLGETTLNINGATLKSPYIGIRLFNNHRTETATVNLNSGVVEGGSRDIWAQNPSPSAVDANAIVNIASTYNYEMVVQTSSSSYGSRNYYIG